MGAIASKMEAAEFKMAPIDSKMTPAEAKMKAAEFRMGPAKVKMEAIERKIDPIDPKIDPTERKIESIGRKIDPIEAKIDPIGRKMDPLGARREPWGGWRGWKYFLKGGFYGWQGRIKLLKTRPKLTPFLMKQAFDNEFTMFSTVRDFMGAHTAETTGVPAIPTAVAALTTVITQIDAAATAQGAPLTGIAEDKEVARTALEDAAFLVSENLVALAAAANNNTLLEEMDMTRAGLDALTAEKLDEFATRVAARGAANQTVLTGTYGVTLAQVTAVTTARTAFAPWVNKPRTAVADRAGLTASLPALIRQGRVLLKNQLDRLMGRYRLTNPSLYAGYKSARVIVDRQGPGGTTAALEIAAAVKTGPTQATLTYANAGGAGAVSITLQWKAPGEADFGHGVPVVRPSQVVNNAAWAGLTVEFQTAAVNGAGLVRRSAVQAVSF